MDLEQSSGQKCCCRAPRDNDCGQRTRVRAAEAWLGSLSPSCHLAQAEGSRPHHAGLAQKARTGEGFIHPPTSLIQQTNLRPVDDAAVLVFLKCEIGALKQLRKIESLKCHHRHPQFSFLDLKCYTVTSNQGAKDNFLFYLILFRSHSHEPLPLKSCNIFPPLCRIKRWTDLY